MRNLLILAVAASFAVACAGRTEDEVGAAPERDTTTVITTDTTGVTTDTIGQTPAPTDTSFVPQDTTGVTGDTTGYTGDTTGMTGDTTPMTGDTTGVSADTSFAPTPSVGDTLNQQGADTGAGAWNDTTGVSPSDTTKY
jgi:hypothetical protein